jgi:hypothetical protein
VPVGVCQVCVLKLKASRCARGSRPAGGMSASSAKCWGACSCTQFRHGVSGVSLRDSLSGADRGVNV